MSNTLALGQPNYLSIHELIGNINPYSNNEVLNVIFIVILSLMKLLAVYRASCNLNYYCLKLKEKVTYISFVKCLKVIYYSSKTDLPTLRLKFLLRA